MGQARRMVGQAPWSGPEESLNLFMTNSAVSCVFFWQLYFHIVS